MYVDKLTSPHVLCGKNVISLLEHRDKDQTLWGMFAILSLVLAFHVAFVVLERHFMVVYRRLR